MVEAAIVACLNLQGPREIGAKEALLHAVEVSGGAALEDENWGRHKELNKLAVLRAARVAIIVAWNGWLAAGAALDGGAR